MTSNAVIAAIFLSPVVMALVVGVIFVANEGKSPMIPVWGSLIALATSGLILLLSRLMMTWIHRELPPRFAALAAELGGQVTTNLLGERQLRLPHARGRVELDYRYFGGDSDRRGEPFTRLALVCPAGGLPAERHKMSVKTGATNLRADALAEVAGLQAAFGDRTRVHLDGRARVPAVEVWIHGWLDDPAAVRRAIEAARPRLEALASRPWSSASMS